MCKYLLSAFVDTIRRQSVTSKYKLPNYLIPITDYVKKKLYFNHQLQISVWIEIGLPYKKVQWLHVSDVCVVHWIKNVEAFALMDCL